MINSITGEKIHKINLNPDTTIPYVDEDILTEWIKTDNKDGQNYLLIKLLTIKKTIRKYGDLRIYKTGKIEYSVDIDDSMFNDIQDDNPLFNRVISGINKIKLHLNIDYNKFIVDSIKNSDTVKILNYIPKSVTPLSNGGYKDILSKIDVNFSIKLDKRLDPRFFPPFINCLYPFVKIENPGLIVSKKIRFRTSMIDNFDKHGFIKSISLHY